MYTAYKFRYYPSTEAVVIHTRDMNNDRFITDTDLSYNYGGGIPFVTAFNKPKLS